MPSAPRAIDHVGLTVPDIEAATRFLAQAFDGRPVYDVQPIGQPPMAGAETERQLGLPKGAKIIHMRLIRIGDGPSIELFQFADAPQSSPAALPDFGFQHVALYVDDIDAAANRFEAAGGTLLSPPHPLGGVEDQGRNRGVYGRAPWGSLFELISYPDGIAYPGGTTRWTPAPEGKSA
ncbi:glyoxalase [Sphingomonas oleivorans]|uniref:Glyoxalase n=1 Tax=Sphingomonas oleivorans TaxID=1735121 RepID=A0A2T5FWP0_9SPHN|nr:VOC family protein [Sphingomonas oleivorans]PTQ10178.1 glyoxalase [Sphingomonas oleivorans]